MIYIIIGHISLSVFLTFFFARKNYTTNIFQLTLLMWLFAVILVSAAFVGVQPLKRYKELVSYRLHSLKWIDHTGSYSFRDIENEHAVKTIQNNPVFGIGYTRPYRPQLYYPEDKLRHFVHNGYLWILLKLGLAGFIPFLWFSYLFIKRGLGNWEKINNDSHKAIVLGSVVWYLGILRALCQLA